MEELLGSPRRKSSSISFPLPPNVLPTVQLTPAEEQHYRLTASNIVDATIEMESEFQFNDAGQVDTEQWKLAAEAEGIRVYKRARGAHADDSDESTQPMVVSVGTMPGTIEDVLYGFHCGTTDEIRVVTAILNPVYLDAAVVAVIQKPTLADPFRHMALKWRMNSTPAGTLVKSRDTFTIDSIGIDVDDSGSKFGYYAMKSVERSDFPPFSPSIAIRARLSLCYIFRQVGPNTVGVYAKGTMDLGGDFPEWFSYNYACPRLPAILETIKSQTAKRITALAIKESRILSPESINRSGFFRMHSGSSLSSGSERESTNSGPEYPNDQFHCAVCRRKSGLLRSSLKKCQICEFNACSKCTMKVELLALPSNIKIVCCKSCVLKAKALPIDTGVLCPILRRWRRKTFSHES